jgi:hypothetical protein
VPLVWWSHAAGIGPLTTFAVRGALRLRDRDRRTHTYSRRGRADIGPWRARFRSERPPCHHVNGRRPSVLREGGFRTATDPVPPDPGPGPLPSGAAPGPSTVMCGSMTSTETMTVAHLAAGAETLLAATAGCVRAAAARTVPIARASTAARPRTVSPGDDVWGATGTRTRVVPGRCPRPIGMLFAAYRPHFARPHGIPDALHP